MIKHLSVRARLLAAFFGISAFAVFSAIAAMYAFFEVGESLERITQRRVPSALTSQQLASHAEEMVAVAPAVLKVTTTEQYEGLSKKVTADVDRLNKLLAELKRSEVEPAALHSIEPLVKWLGINLINLNTIAYNNLTLVEQKTELLGELSDTHTQVQDLMASGILALEIEVSRLNKTIGDPGLSSDARMVALAEVSQSIVSLLPLRKVQLEALAINDTLLNAASAETRSDLRDIAAPLNGSLDTLETLVTGLDPRLRQTLSTSVDKFRAFTKGRNSILLLRERQLENIDVEQQLRGQADVSRQLTEAVERLIAAAKQDIIRANNEVLSVQRVGAAILITVVALSLISSTLIVWLYVGRNLIARLSALSNSMLAIAGGNLKASLPPSGNDEIGRMAEALTVFRDTAVEVEEGHLREIAAARQRLLDAIESVSDGFALYDPDDRLVLCNSRYRNVLYPGSDVNVTPGITFEAIIRNAAERGLIRDAEGRIDAWVAERLERHHNPSESHVQRRGDGSWMRITEHKTQDGSTVAVYTDITELKQRQAELAELVNKLEIARDQAMQATRAKSEFLANMSHELRTPLNAIIGLAELLLEDAKELGQDDQIEPLERIHRAGAHLLQLINDLLDLSKIEAGKMELHITEFDLAHVISEAVKTAQPLADKNNNRLSVHCPAEIGMLRADDIRLRQAVLNLLSNACKFTENGEVRVEVEASAVDGTDGVSISVADTGIGMMPEHMNMLFQDFVQADTSTTRKYGGTGLGLAISLRFCRLMGGDITVESAAEQGSTFRIWLPRVATVLTTGEEQAIPQPVVPLVERTTAASKQTTAQRTVLVIDDDPNVRDLLTASLTREGYDVATAANGVEGLTRARELKPMLIILDIIMPGLDGWAVLTACKGDPDLADIPVIMLTIVDDRTRGYALGAAEYLVKPIDRKRLRAVLEKHCGVHGETLMIEDDEVARDTARKAAEKQGFTVIEAADGHEALKRLAENSPDLILLDLLMPEMDGFEFLVELNKNSDWRDIPVVVLTAKDLTDEDRRRLNGRVTSIAKKGVMSPREILEELRAVIESRQAAVTAA